MDKDQYPQLSIFLEKKEEEEKKFWREFRGAILTAVAENVKNKQQRRRLGAKVNEIFAKYYPMRD